MKAAEPVPICGAIVSLVSLGRRRQRLTNNRCNEFRSGEHFLFFSFLPRLNPGETRSDPNHREMREPSLFLRFNPGHHVVRVSRQREGGSTSTGNLLGPITARPRLVDVMGSFNRIFPCIFLYLRYHYRPEMTLLAVTTLGYFAETNLARTSLNDKSASLQALFDIFFFISVVCVHILNAFYGSAHTTSAVNNAVKLQHIFVCFQAAQNICKKNKRPGEGKYD